MLYGGERRSAPDVRHRGEGARCDVYALRTILTEWSALLAQSHHPRAAGHAISTAHDLAGGQRRVREPVDVLTGRNPILGTDEGVGPH